MCWLYLCVIVKGCWRQQPANPQISRHGLFAAASLRSEYKPESEFRKMLVSAESHCG